MPTDDVTARARAEAERRHPHTGTTGVDERRAARRLSFIAGAEWQHAQDAETIEALRAEVERLRRDVESAQRGTEIVRSEGAEWFRRSVEHVKERDAERARAEAAEAEVATLRAHLDNAARELDGVVHPDDPHCRICRVQGWLRAALADPEVPRD